MNIYNLTDTLVLSLSSLSFKSKKIKIFLAFISITATIVSLTVTFKSSLVPTFQPTLIPTFLQPTFQPTLIPITFKPSQTPDTVPPSNKPSKKNNRKS